MSKYSCMYCSIVQYIYIQNNNTLINTNITLYDTLHIILCMYVLCTYYTQYESDSNYHT